MAERALERALEEYVRNNMGAYVANAFQVGFWTAEAKMHGEPCTDLRRKLRMEK
ncbi:MAG: hypothetical protein HYW25_05425 [Candidatus Aenigmarchaeota archaeon]|nr:hypothetical protein [Candidatus Aenigmarchaeota archaeon]